MLRQVLDFNHGIRHLVLRCVRAKTRVCVLAQIKTKWLQAAHTTTSTLDANPTPELSKIRGSRGPNSATPQWGTEKCPERKIPNQKTSEIRVPISAFDYRLCLWNLSTEVSMKFEV